MPGSSLPLQLQSITAVGWYQFVLLNKLRHMCVNDLSSVTAWWRNGHRELNLQAVNLPVAPPRDTVKACQYGLWKLQSVVLSMRFYGKMFGAVTESVGHLPWFYMEILWVWLEMFGNLPWSVDVKCCMLISNLYYSDFWYCLLFDL